MKYRCELVFGPYLHALFLSIIRLLCPDTSTAHENVRVRRDGARHLCARRFCLGFGVVALHLEGAREADLFAIQAHLVQSKDRRRGSSAPRTTDRHAEDRLSVAPRTAPRKHGRERRTGPLMNRG